MRRTAVTLGRRFIRKKVAGISATAVADLRQRGLNPKVRDAKRYQIFSDRIPRGISEKGSDNLPNSEGPAPQEDTEIPKLDYEYLMKKALLESYVRENASDSHEKIQELSFSFNIDVNEVTVNGGKKLLQLAAENLCLSGKEDKRNATKILSVLIYSGANSKVKNTNGQSLLSVASAAGNIYAMKFLITEVRANLESRDNNGRTPLIWAASAGNFEAMEFLLKNGALADAVDEFESTALSRIIVGGSLAKKDDSMDLLLHYGAKSELNLAITMDDLTAVKIFLKKGVDFALTGNEDALHLADKLGKEEMVEALLDAGVDPAVTYEGKTPAQIAAQVDNPDSKSQGSKDEIPSPNPVDPKDAGSAKKGSNRGGNKGGK